jgi:hypothetical protein
VSREFVLRYFSKSELTLQNRLNPPGARIDQEAKVSDQQQQVHRGQQSKAPREPTISWGVNQARVPNTMQVRTETCTVGKQATTAQLVERVTSIATDFFEYIGVRCWFGDETSSALTFY